MDEAITQENWVRFQILILDFNWDETEADLTNIKELILQLKASGDILLDHIMIVPHIETLENYTFLLWETNTTQEFEQFDFHKEIVPVE